MTSEERLRADQADWRKGVELIASSLGEQNPPDLSCVRIAQVALEQRARIEAALALHAANAVGPEGLECSCGKLHPCPTVKALGGEK